MGGYSLQAVNIVEDEGLHEIIQIVSTDWNAIESHHCIEET